MIDELRRKFPGPWRWDADEYAWIGPEFRVEPRAYYAPKNEYDDSWATMYVNPATGREVDVGDLGYL